MKGSCAGWITRTLGGILEHQDTLFHSFRSLTISPLFQDKLPTDVKVIISSGHLAGEDKPFPLFKEEPLYKQSKAKQSKANTIRHRHRHRIIDSYTSLDCWETVNTDGDIHSTWLPSFSSLLLFFLRYLFLGGWEVQETYNRLIRCTLIYILCSEA